MPAVPRAADITWPKSNSLTLDFPVKQSDGTTAYNLTGATVLWMLKADINEADASAMLNKSSAVGGSGLTITSAVAGTVVLALTDTEMAALTADATYVYDLQLQAADGTTATLLIGNLKIDAVVRQGFAV